MNNHKKRQRKSDAKLYCKAHGHHTPHKFMNYCAEYVCIPCEYKRLVSNTNRYLQDEYSALLKGG